MQKTQLPIDLLGILNFDIKSKYSIIIVLATDFGKSMQLSTSKILDVLRQLPSTGKLKPVDFAERATETDQRTDTVVAQDGNTEDVLQLKVQPPRMTPQHKNKLTLKEQQALDDRLIFEKGVLNNFKNMLMQKGFDVSHYFVSIQNGKISHYIPNQQHYHFFMQHKNKFINQVNAADIEPARSPRRSR